MEYEAERGADEIASCLFRWVETEWRFGKADNPNFKRLRIFSDNASGKIFFVFFVLFSIN